RASTPLPAALSFFACSRAAPRRPPFPTRRSSDLVRRLLAQPFSSLANLLVIALTLTVPILGASILITAQPVARQLSVSPEMTIFLSPSADADASAGIAQRLKADFADDVASVKVVKRDEA